MTVTPEGMASAAEALAAYAHKGQKDKAGKDYILHPAAVAARMDTEEEKTVAFLHDILEDTHVTEQTIEDIFGERICRAVVMMTRKDGEDYGEYIRRLGGDPLARKVKLADLAHNMDMSRLPHVTEHDMERLERYRKAVRYLESLR